MREQHTRQQKAARAAPGEGKCLQTPGAEITVFEKDRGILSKVIALNEDGTVSSDGSACSMASGTAFRQSVEDIDHFAHIIGTLKPYEAIALGRLRHDLADEVPVVTKEELRNHRDAIARSREFLIYKEGRLAFMFLDIDVKGMPPETARKVDERGIWNVITTAAPKLKLAASIERASTSAGLRRRDTGEELPGSGGWHIYLVVRDGADIRRALETLHKRLWLAGFGHMVINKVGQLLERSLVDQYVYGPEHLSFEGGPELGPGLVQDKQARAPTYTDGEIVDTRRAIPPLSPAEQREFGALKAEAARRLKPEAEAARTKRAKEFAQERGLSEETAKRIFEAAVVHHILEREFVLEFDDDELGVRTVGEVVGDADKYVGKTLADPFEGRSYGKGKAKIFRRSDGQLLIHSFAHGRQIYRFAAGVMLKDFHAYMPAHNYFYEPTREPWPAVSVNSRLDPIPIVGPDGTPVLDDKGKPKKIAASRWLDQNRAVEQVTWAPGEPMLIRDRLVADGGWVERPGVACFNLYRPPSIEPGDPAKAGRWLDHVHRVFPKEAEHTIAWLAHRVQRPHEKINHALVLGGAQGIGKDTILEPVKYAVGPWNFIEVSPQQVLGRFNGFLKSAILRVSEARDLGDKDRFAFYDHMKAITAAPPDVLRVDEKHLREYSILNVTGVIITTNHKTDGVHLEADDRRHFVAWSVLTKEDFAQDYWTRLYRWYDKGGRRHVAAYLAELDIASFDAKAPPPKTPAFWDIVDAGRTPEDAELADVLDEMGNPDATTLGRVQAAAGGSFLDWIIDRKNRRMIPHRLEKCGYTSVRNASSKDGLWRVYGVRQVIYARNDLAESDRQRAARELMSGEQQRGEVKDGWMDQ